MSGCSYKWQTAKIRSKKEERDQAYTRRNETVFDFCNRQTSEVSGGRTILNYEVISITPLQILQIDTQQSMKEIIQSAELLNVSIRVNTERSQKDGDSKLCTNYHITTHLQILVGIPTSKVQQLNLKFYLSSSAVFLWCYATLLGCRRDFRLFFKLIIE